MELGNRTVRDYLLNGGVKGRRFLMGDLDKDDYQIYEVRDIVPLNNNGRIGLVIKVQGKRKTFVYGLPVFLNDLEVISS